MAGILVKAVGADAIYEGTYQAGETLTNGMFVEVGADGTVKKLTAAGDMELVVRDKEDLWGLKAMKLEVTHAGKGETYFVENVWDINDGKEYDEKDYEVQAGEYVRMHRLLEGEQIRVSVDSALHGTLSVGDAVTPAAAETIAKLVPKA